MSSPNYLEIKYDQRCTLLHLHPLSFRREITDLLGLYVFLNVLKDTMTYPGIII